MLIEPPRAWEGVDWGELWRHRELLAFLVWRDLKVRYRQTVLGAGWAIFVPLIQMVFLTVIFEKVARLPTDGLPGPLFYFVGLLPWNYFSNAVSGANNSLVQSAGFLTKVYVPRLLIPAAPCITALVDFLVAFVMLALLMAFYGIAPRPQALALPLLMLVVMSAALGMGWLTASLSVRYRDIRHLLPLLLQLWTYATVILPFSALPQEYGNWRYLYGLNPLAGVVEGCRWLLLGGSMNSVSAGTGQPATPAWLLLAVGTPVALLMLAGGLLTFKRMERSFADMV